jgi:hypothetical protein
LRHWYATLMPSLITITEYDAIAVITLLVTIAFTGTGHAGRCWCHYASFHFRHFYFHAIRHYAHFDIDWFTIIII